MLRIPRLLQIVMTVASRRDGQRITRRTLAEDAECSVRTIGRDLDELRAAEIPVDWNHSLKSFALPADGWTAPLLRLKPVEVMAMAMARGLLTSPMLPHANLVRSTFEKVTAGLPAQLLSMLDEQAAAIRVTGMARDYSRAPVTPLLSAITRREQVEIDYESRRSKQRSWRRVDPYGFEDREGMYLELHAWCHRQQKILTFALDRIFGVHFAGDRFDLKEREWQEFVTQQGIIGGLRGGPAIEVHVRFDVEVAEYATDRRWPAGLTATTQPDGSVELTGAVQGTDGIIREILRWRRHAHVLGGPELLAAMAAEIRAMASLYEII